jgi:hypothetical protein
MNRSSRLCATRVRAVPVYSQGRLHLSLVRVYLEDQTAEEGYVTITGKNSHSMLC